MENELRFFAQQPPSPETGVTFERRAEKLGENILEELETRYPEKSENPHEQYEYHNRAHSEGVGNIADELLLKVPGYQEDSRRRALVKLMGYGHDIDQEHLWVPAPGGLWQERKRNVFYDEEGNLKPNPGIIEQRSLEDLEKKEAEFGIAINDDEKDLQQQGIMVTVPGFGPVADPNSEKQYFTVLQPNLNENSSLEAWAIAAADIASAGYDPEHFLADGDNVFKEDHMLPTPESLNDEDAEKVLAKVLGWTEFQIQYAMGQKILWSQDRVPDFLRQQLEKFDESIDLCKTRLFARRALASTGNTPQEKLRLVLNDMNFTRYIKIES